MAASPDTATRFVSGSRSPKRPRCPRRSDRRPASRHLRRHRAASARSRLSLALDPPGDRRIAKQITRIALQYPVPRPDRFDPRGRRPDRRPARPDPHLALGAGSVADAVDRRRLLFLTRIRLMACGAALLLSRSSRPRRSWACSPSRSSRPLKFTRVLVECVTVFHRSFHSAKLPAKGKINRARDSIRSEERRISLSQYFYLFDSGEWNGIQVDERLGEC